MNRLEKKSLRMCSVGTMVLLGLAALGGTAKPALGQEMVQGKFTLPFEARLGKTLLSAGEYKFYVAPLGNIRSVNSIQPGISHVLVVVSGMTKRGPVASVMAMASNQTDTLNPKGLDIREDGSGMMIHSMCLEKLGLVFEFNENGAKNHLHARKQELPQGTTAAKASD